MSKHKHADKIMLFAKMVEAGHSPNEIVQVKYGNGWYSTIEGGLTWSEHSEHRVARAMIDGKPVFSGDRVWSYELKQWFIIADIPLPLTDAERWSLRKPSTVSLTIPVPIFIQEIDSPICPTPHGIIITFSSMEERDTAIKVLRVAGTYVDD